MTTVIASELDQTRTCFFSEGSCGELTPGDVEEALAKAGGDLFRNVILFHSDAWHSDPACIVAQEAKLRGIPISVDI